MEKWFQWRFEKKKRKKKKSGDSKFNLIVFFRIIGVFVSAPNLKNVAPIRRVILKDDDDPLDAFMKEITKPGRPLSFFSMVVTET